MKLFTLAATVGTLLTTGISTAEAHPRFHHHSHNKRVVVEKQVVVKPAPVRKVMARALVGEVFDSIPHNHVRVAYASKTYYVHDGVYYIKEGPRYLVVRPVAGIRIAALPAGYTTVRINGVNHYRFNNVTYRRVNNYYVVI